MTIHLTLPVGTRDHIQGSERARVTLVEYGDFECPYCGRAYPIVKALKERLGSGLRFVFRNFPLREVHPHAEVAAEAAEAAGAQGRFWEMHDTLFEHQRHLSNLWVLGAAARLGLDTERFAHDVGSGAFLPRVEADLASGVSSGVGGTPTFFIDGQRHEGSFDYETLLSALESAPRRRAAG